MLLADGDLWFTSSSDEVEIFFLFAPSGGEASTSENPESWLAIMSFGIIRILLFFAVSPSYAYLTLVALTRRTLTIAPDEHAALQFVDVALRRH